MTKKEYILKILESLVDDWELAKGLAIIVVNSKESSKILDLILNILKESLKESKNLIFKEKINNSISKIKKQRNIEKKENLNELLSFEKELENI